MKKFTLHIHPYVAAYVNKGLYPLSIQWKLKYSRRLKIIPNQNLGFLEYKFFDKNNEEIDMKEDGDNK